MSAFVHDRPSTPSSPDSAQIERKATGTPLAKISFVADAGRHYWSAVEQICEGFEAAVPALLLELGTALATMAGRWERYLVREIALGEKHGQFDVEDRDAVARCDRQFYQLLTRFEPGYELLPNTVARLL